MKTKEDVMNMLDRERNSWTAVRSTDSNGNNESYSTAEIESILDNIEEYDFEFVGVSPAGDIDIDVWAQEFNTGTREGLRKDLAAGSLYVARFYSDERGEMDLLLWV